MITMEIPMDGGLCGPPVSGAPPHHGGMVGQMTTLEYDTSKGGGDDKKKQRECKYLLQFLRMVSCRIFGGLAGRENVLVQNSTVRCLNFVFLQIKR